jgi:hypothetical protein
MIAGAFSDAERAATEALEIAGVLGEAAEPEAIHAMTTLAVVRGWGDDAESAVPILRDAIERPVRAGSSRSGGGPAPTWPSCWSCWGGRTGDRGRLRDMEEVARTTSTPSTGSCWAARPGLLVDVGRWEEARS